MRVTKLGLLGVTALGAACAFSFIDGKSLSFDEGISLWFAQLDLLDLWNGVHHFDAVLAPYYALLHLWVGTFGTSPAAARSLSAVAAVATIPGVYLLARLVFERRTALVASTL
jgi:mannosyltransferase